MLFAWQGLRFEHPGDWAPVSLSGDRSQGYARISSAGSGFVQIRWQRSNAAAPEPAVQKYLAKLEKDARRRSVNFSSKSKVAGAQVNYSYKSDFDGKGTLFPLADSKGLVFLESVNSPAAILRQATSTFEVQDSEREQWALLGLNILVPRGLKLDSYELKAGKTVLQLTGGKMRVVAERWGFAEMLLQKKPLQEWVKSVSNLNSAESESFPSKVCLYQKRSLLPSIWVRAVVQEEMNQISLIRVESRHSDLQPQWNWFGS